MFFYNFIKTREVINIISKTNYINDYYIYIYTYIYIYINFLCIICIYNKKILCENPHCYLFF